MKFLTILYCTVFGFLISMPAEAQHRVMMNVNYSVSVPIGDFADFIDNTSFRGWNANIMYRINPKFAIGATTGFQDYYKKVDRQVYKDADGRDISAVVSHSIQSIPLLATAQYAFSPEQRVQPYVAIGAGANLIMRSRYLGQFADDDNKVKLAARPEAGLFIPIKKESEGGITIAGFFHFLPYNQDGIKNMNGWGITAGAKFPLR